MKYLSYLIKPASSLCNMRCSYCFYADVASHREHSSYGVMSRETMHRIIDNSFAALDPDGTVLFGFQGGEPTLAGKDYFREFFAAVDAAKGSRHVDYAFQTNGYLIDDEWCEILGAQPNMLVGLSLDGDAATHNDNRKGPDGKGSFSRVFRAKTLFDKHGIEYNVLTTLTNGTARYPAKIWNFLVKENIRYVQFTPCLSDLDANQRTRWALTPQRFYSFYSALFPLWKGEVDKGNIISVKLFDDIMNQFLLGRPSACGINGRCSVQNVVESNGDVFPCDFYVLDRFRLGSLLESRPDELIPKGAVFLADGREYAAQEPCRSCRYRTVCGGGCKRMKDSMYIAEDGVCWYSRLLDELVQPLCDIGRQFLNRRG